jgi:pimeloyl-ACP methyl ester carboxylesterase
VRGCGLGDRFIALAKARRPHGLTLYTFRVNGPARRFYERHGFVVVDETDGERNAEKQPDVRYAWSPDGRPSIIRSPDGTPIAVFASGPPAGPPLVLVHGTTADHTTWRASAPVLARAHRVHAIDRRGRGASGDGPAPYRIDAELADLAAVADAIAAEHSRPVDVVGHSYGGRIGLGAALLTASIRRVVSYEGAPSPPAGQGYGRPGTLERIAALVEAGERDLALEAFFRDIVGMPESDLARYRTDPVWPVRAAAVETSLREIEGERSPAASLEALGRVTQPVLQVLGGASPAPFAEATRALDERLVDGRVVVIGGARHAAHHTHVEAFTDAIRSFLDDADMAD